MGIDMTHNIPTVYGDGGPLAHIPDDVTIPQFLFDQHHPLGGQALHSRSPTYFIDDATGRHINGEEVSIRAHQQCVQRPRLGHGQTWSVLSPDEDG